MDTQNKVFDITFKANHAAAKNYGESSISFAMIASFLVSVCILSLFVPFLIAFAISVLFSYIIFKKLSIFFKAKQISALEENRRKVDAVIAPYGLATYYDGSWGYFDKMTFFDKETDDVYRSVAGRVNGNVVTMTISND